jgi:hypothetical protein
MSLIMNQLFLDNTALHYDHKHKVDSSPSSLEVSNRNYHSQMVETLTSSNVEFDFAEETKGWDMKSFSLMLDSFQILSLKNLPGEHLQRIKDSVRLILGTPFIHTKMAM